MSNRNEWRRKLVLERRRGYPCLVLLGGPSSRGPYYDTAAYADYNGPGRSGGLCGCGDRDPAPVKYRRRIVKRRLKAELRDIVGELE